MERNLNQAMENYDDDDVAKSLKWFLAFMSPAEWEDRRTKIENHIEHVIMVGYGLASSTEHSMVLSVDQDKICWYLYMMDTCLYDASKYDPVQGARVFPIFKQLGQHLELLKSIDGVSKKVRRLIQKDPKDADAVLFELLTALVWARNKWKVSFLPEVKSSKQPDLKAVKNNSEWFIECKRFTRTADYTAKEKEIWLKMQSHIKNILMAKDLVLDVIIHVELHTLPETYLLDTLGRKLMELKKPGEIISNKILKVQASFVDYQAINRHLQDFSVRSPSPQLNQLIGGRRDDNKGFTSGTISKPFRLGPGKGNNIFIDQLAKAYGIFWVCDAPEAIDAKARDIKRHLVAALKQLPKIENSVVHIGIETYDGPEVELHRFKKINRTLSDFVDIDKNLSWVYCHFFQSYAPPDQSWVFDESLVRYNNVIVKSKEPLKKTSLIVPWEKTEENNMHWFKSQP